MVNFAQLDWSLVQAFLAVAETGSLSAAARQLGTSQPTVGRQVQALETQLGTSLFSRQSKGMALSDAGHVLLGPASLMRDAAGELALTAAGAAGDMRGTVRVTSSVFTAQYHLPKILAKVRQEHPEIQLEVVASDTSENLLFREADIALRMYRPTQLDMVTRHLGDLALGIYATPEYLERVGAPETTDDFFAYDFIGYDRNEVIIEGMRHYGKSVSREDFPVRCDNHTVCWELVRAGLGIGFVQTSVAENDPSVVRLFPDFPLPALPIWLTAHPAVRRLPRISVVWDALVEGMAEHLSPPGALPNTVEDAARQAS